MIEWHIYVIAVAAWLLTYIKIPFKLITKRIADETVRTRVNKLIILLPIIFGFLGVLLDMAIFDWTAGDCFAIVYPGLHAAGIAVIIYSAVEKFFTGKTDGEYDGLISFMVSAGFGSRSMARGVVEKCLTLSDGKIAEYIGGVMPDSIPAPIKSLITSALQAYANKLSEKKV